MMSEYTAPGNSQASNQSEEKQNTSKNPSNQKQEHKLETDGPAKDKNFKVLNEDGSLADMPDKEGAGSGALDGTVGRGM